MKARTRVLVLANSDGRGAAALRATAFAERLQGRMGITVASRKPGKIEAFYAFARVVLFGSYDVVLVVDTAFAGVAAAIVGRVIKNVPFILDTGDAAYELAKSAGERGICGLAATAVLERSALSLAEGVSVRGSFHKTILNEKVRKPIEWIPDGVDLERFKPAVDNELRRSLGLERGTVVGVLGSMSWSVRHEMCYGWDLVEALAGLPRDVIGLFVGDGDGRRYLEERASSLGISDRCRFVGQIPFEDLPRYICAMDICLSTQSNDLVGRVRTTGKLPLYLACNRYVIATAVGEGARVVPEVGCTLEYSGVRDNTYPARLASAIRRLVACREELNRGNMGRAVAAREFDYDLLAKRLEGLIRRVIAGAKKHPAKESTR